MTSPRFAPRNYCLDPSQFGRYSDIHWRHPSGGSDQLDQWETARFQHRMAVQVREALAARNQALDDYAAEQGLNRNRIGRLLRGDIIMRLEDVMNVRRNLGLTQ